MVQKIIAFLDSKRCWYLIIAFFALSALWIALSGRYPMAFDEDFHMGIIRLYAHHLSPFWSGQPAGAETLGAVGRDPSYLYQWLMSFPYRISSNLIFLRLINIALFTWGLFLYRKLLLMTGASRALVHFCLALFVLIPVVPLLAAQVNYDNLFLPMTALTLLITVRFSRTLSHSKRIDGQALMALACVGLLTSLVKYAFLPVLLAIAVYILIRLRQTYGSLGGFWAPLREGLARRSRRSKWLFGPLLIIAVVLFTQRFGVNAVRYHTPVPACDAVLSVQQCNSYAPWSRDHYLEGIKDERATTSPLVFMADWFYGMWLRLFFAVDGPASNFRTRGPLILPGIGAIVFAVAALAASVVTLQKTWRNYDRQVLWLFVLATATYTTVLAADEFHSFLNTGEAVAINGRYLLPVLPLLILLLGLGANTFLDGRRRLKLTLAGLALLCLLWGGGALTYILRSSDSWYWHNQAVYDANHAVQHVFGPVTPGYYSPTEFMGRN